MRSYYSGAYSSSTNAYMLMYRQIDKQRNCEAMTVDEFPAHIKVGIITLSTWNMWNKQNLYAVYNKRCYVTVCGVFAVVTVC